MIFKRLFSPGWKHSDPEKRLKAIDELSADNVEHKGILRELAFNDQTRRVRLKALEKLNDLSFWWLAYRQDHDDSNREKCKQKILTLFSTNDVSIAKKTEFCQECPDNSLLTELYLVMPESEMRKLVLEKLNKQEMYVTAAEKDADDTLCLWAVEHIQDDKALRRLSRRPLPSDRKQRVVEILQQREELKLKPGQIEQKATLLTSQLNALADKLSEPKAIEQPELADRVEKLKSQWEILVSDLDWHPNRALAEQKHSEISKRVNGWLEKLQQAWKANRDKEELALKKRQNAAALSAGLEQLHQKLTDAFFQEESPSTDALHAELTEVQDALANQQIDEKNENFLRVRVKEIEGLYQDLVNYPSRLQDAKDVLEALRSMDPKVDDAYQAFARWKKDWRRFADLPLPEKLKHEQSNLLETWEEAAAKTRKQAQAKEKECRRLLGIVNRSLQSGQYKLAIRLFNKANGLLPTLTEKVQKNLSSQFERLNKRITELEDWHEYIAQPKMSDLLTEIQNLATKPLSDPEQQSVAVKDLRQRWQQLIVDASQDHVEEQRLFDEASEKAFAVCREHYAEQQSIRQKNLQAYEQICSKLEAMHQSLEDSNLSFSELESEYRKLTRQWREAGEVDFKLRPALRSRYRSATGPIVEKLNSIYAQHAQKKERLINQANAISADSSEDAGREFAALMNSWKQIGYAGKPDRSLWQQFSTIGSALRDKQRSDRADQIAGWQAKAEQAQKIVETFRQQMVELSSVQDINKAITQAESDFEGLEGLGPRDRNQISESLEQAISEAKNKIGSVLAEKQSKQWQQVLDAISALTRLEMEGSDMSDWRAAVEPSFLSNGLAQQVAALFDSERTREPSSVLDERNKLLLTMEIITGVESPGEQTAARNQRQVEMLAERMQGAVMDQPRNLFWKWLAASKLSDEDKPLVDRLLRVAGKL